jgi:hypothetical protein
MHRRWFFLLALLLPLVSWPHALARPVLTGHAATTVGDVGAHYPLFIVAKSHHPENLTVVYTKLDRTAACSRTATMVANPRSTSIG